MAEQAEENGDLIQRLATASASLASAKDAEEQKGNEVQRLTRTLEAAVSAQQSLREEADERAREHEAALAEEAKGAVALRGAAAGAAEAAAATQAKLAAEWAATAEAKGAAESARLECRRMTDTVAQRELAVAQQKAAADRAEKLRGQTDKAHTQVRRPPCRPGGRANLSLF